MSAWLARGAYALALRLLAPAYLARLLWRSRAEPLYAHALGERFGFFPRPSAAHAGGTGRWVWVHAVSLGETRAAAALISEMRALQPGMRLLLTHGTATGREAGRGLLQEGDAQAWLPCDTPGAVRRFLAFFQPAVGVLMETEVWPQLLHQARRSGVPMLLANGRLSERSLRRGERLRALLRPAAQALRLVMAQTQADAERFRQAGCGHVVVCGNLKFDMRPDEGQLAQGRAWRQAAGRAVVLAASTREGEEAPLLAAWKRQVVDRPGDGRQAAPLLVVVPRHPQRFDEVARLAESTGLALRRRSSWQGGRPPDASDGAGDVWLGDSMGEMALYYSLAHVALLGGSFAPLGGQNLIEAAACGCPVVMGPHTFNFAQAAEMAQEAGVAWRVADVEEGVARALGVAASDSRTEWAIRAGEFAGVHRGAARTMAGLVLRGAASPPIA